MVYIQAERECICIIDIYIYISCKIHVIVVDQQDDFSLLQR